MRADARTPAGLGHGWPQLDSGAAIGLNPDSTVEKDKSRTLLFYADKEVGTTIFTNLGSPASMRHGAYGMLIVEPKGSIWLDSFTGKQLGSFRTAVQAASFPPNGEAFREFALTRHSTDQQFTRNVIPYMNVVAGSGINPARDAGGQPPLREAPIAGAPAGDDRHQRVVQQGLHPRQLHLRTADGPDRVGRRAGSPRRR